MKVVLAENENDFLVGLVEVLQDLGMDVNATETEEGLTEIVPCLLRHDGTCHRRQ